MKIRVTPSNGSFSSNEENINVEDVPDAVTYVKPPSKKPLTIYNLLYSLKKDKRFELKEMFQQNISKFATFYVKEKTDSFLFFNEIFFLQLKKIHKYMTFVFHLL